MEIIFFIVYFIYDKIEAELKCATNGYTYN